MFIGLTLKSQLANSVVSVLSPTIWRLHSLPCARHANYEVAHILYAGIMRALREMKLALFKVGFG